MARLCLSGGGTTWLGLYRGLKLKTANTPWDVCVMDVVPRQMEADSAQPIILSVGIESSARVNGAFELESGWKPGFRHSVLLLPGSPPNYIEIADPNPEIGRERWTADELRTLYRGPAMQLVRRG
jgi:hypothetical protein